MEMEGLPDVKKLFLFHCKADKTQNGIQIIMIDH